MWTNKFSEFFFCKKYLFNNWLTLIHKICSLSFPYPKTPFQLSKCSFQKKILSFFLLFLFFVQHLTKCFNKFRVFFFSSFLSLNNNHKWDEDDGEYLLSIEYERRKNKSTQSPLHINSPSLSLLFTHSCNDCTQYFFLIFCILRHMKI